MRRPTLSQVIREARIKKGWTRPQLAKRLKLSLSYVNHLEYNSPVYLSDDLCKRLRVTLALRNAVLMQLARRQNLKARNYYQEYTRKLMEGA